MTRAGGDKPSFQRPDPGGLPLTAVGHPLFASVLSIEADSDRIVRQGRGSTVKFIGAARSALSVITLWGMTVIPAIAEETDPRPAKGVQDNSFLIEEAYNQEPGVVQHFVSLRRQGRDRFVTFTQEWPLGSQTHQLSYAVPYAWLYDSSSADVTALGVIQLNYRYQAFMESARLPAFAPRLSLIIPTDDPKSELGHGGTQLNLPFSKIIADRVTVHANAGLTTYFDVRGREPTSYNLGGSVVFALSRETNLLVESLAEWTESVSPTRDIEREFALTLVPGIRHAFNVPDAQFVVGVGTPIRFTEAKRDYGVLFYLSLEHKFLR